jgi:hypothetical protein
VLLTCTRPTTRSVPATIVAENGRLIPNRLYTVSQHNILTGSQADGTALPPDT